MALATSPRLIGSFGAWDPNFSVGCQLTVTSTDTRNPFQASAPIPAPDPQGNQAVVFQHYMSALDESALTVTVDSTNRFDKNIQLSVNACQIPSQSVELEMEVLSRAFMLGGIFRDLMGTETADLIKLGQMTTGLAGDND